MHRAKCFRSQSPELWKYRAVDVREDIVFESLLVLFLESLGQLVHEFSVHGLHCDAGESVVIGEIEKFRNANGSVMRDENQDISLIFEPLTAPGYGDDLALDVGIPFLFS